MSTRVQIKDVTTGEVIERFSVDAADMLAAGTHVQIGGPQVAFSPRAPSPAPREPGPPVLRTVTVKPHLKHVGGGRWDVVRADGSNANTGHLNKPDAEALLATIS